MREYCADFETNTYIDDCHVWAWGVADICENPEDTFAYGTSLDEFMEHAFAHPGRYWFHNLKFDGSFITSWLLSHGYEHTEDRPRTGQFSALIDDLGKFYSITVGTKVKFADSYKKITMSVRDVAKTYGLEMSKGEIDYNRYRPVGHEVTAEELDYLRRDVLIMAEAMSVRLVSGTKLTTSSDCLETFRDLYGKERYRATMPVINGVIDAAMRRAYRGGWVYVNPKHKGEDVGRGIRLDVNSLYPWAMRYNPLPVGNPAYFAGKPNPTPKRPLWIAGVTITAKLKPGKLPCIQLRGSSIFGEREYTDAIPDPTPLVVCSVDYALWCEMYDIEVWSWDGGWSFAQREGVFDDYIDTYMTQKQNARTPGERAEAKLKLNGLYGKLAQKILQRGIPREFFAFSKARRASASLFICLWAFSSRRMHGERRSSPPASSATAFVTRTRTASTRSVRRFPRISRFTRKSWGHGNTRQLSSARASSERKHTLRRWTARRSTLARACRNRSRT